MRRLDLTAEDMADLIAGNSINAMVEGGEEIIVAAPDGVNEDWVPPTAQEVAEAYEWADSIIAKIENDESVDSRLCEEAGEHQLTTRHTRAECPMTNEEENS